MRFGGRYIRSTMHDWRRSRANKKVSRNTSDNKCFEKDSQRDVSPLRFSFPHVSLHTEKMYEADKQGVSTLPIRITDDSSKDPCCLLSKE